MNNTTDNEKIKKTVQKPCSNTSKSKILIVVGASEHPLRQMRRLGLAQRLGKYMCPDMETALQLAREAIYKKEEPKPNPREEIRIVEHK